MTKSAHYALVSLSSDTIPPLHPIYRAIFISFSHYLPQLPQVCLLLFFVTVGPNVGNKQSGGRMMHLRVHRPDPKRPSATAPPPPGNLLRTPFETLTERVLERRVIAKSLETASEERAAAAAAAATVAALDSTEVDEESNKDKAGAMGGKERAGDGRGRVGAGEMLWVDKYAPVAFRDLLSDERVNREVLRAVKAWDRFVFKKEVRERPMNVLLARVCIKVLAVL